jgi:hypothetical protein
MSRWLSHFGLQQSPFTKEIADGDLWSPRRGCGPSRHWSRRAGTAATPCSSASRASAKRASCARYTIAFKMVFASPGDTAEYIAHRTKRAGADRELFSSDAIALFHEHTHGRLRDIDRVATDALRLAARKKLRLVDRELVARVFAAGRPARRLILRVNHLDGHRRVGVRRVTPRWPSSFVHSPAHAPDAHHAPARTLFKQRAR